ncbi:uncharacterized protein LOC131177875 [Hevea brasiliensis]|uniref:uncharacterized protein LOC131177875 n=1 Tax=Hevea brasiliensis TaxID=3981 RepID=UPI0025CE2FED|nr:uncharacterized protein LOC131177875 [Hevea brasiliensis]
MQIDNGGNDIFHLHNSDYPGMMLVSSPLTGRNYLSWSRSMVLALRAKDKLGFVDGSYEVPATDATTLDKWKKVDSMVTSWILNSLSKELVDAFIYATSSKNLWEEIKERFGESNGPLLYQLKREISTLTQDNASVLVYFTKLKKLWDELACLKPLLVCECGTAKQMEEINSEDKLMQFLMGLNETYDHVRNQILLMDPLPSVNKAYSMILRVEKQREIHVDAENFNTAMAVKGQFQKDKFQGKKKEFRKKETRTCDHCNASGHTRDTCFKLHGYPEWFTELKQKKGKAKQNTVANVYEEIPECKGKTDHKNEETGVDWASIVQLEIAKYMQNQNLVTNEASCVNFTGFAGKNPTYYSTSRHGKNSGLWIVDSGASTHMCHDFSLFQKPVKLNNHCLVTLPDGNTKPVKYSGNIMINPYLTQ